MNKFIVCLFSTLGILLLIYSFAIENKQESTHIDVPDPHSSYEIKSTIDDIDETRISDNLVREIYPNKSVREYHTRYEVSQEKLNAILAIPGVIKDDIATMGTCIEEGTYTLRVVIGLAFEWDEIEPLVIIILENGIYTTSSIVLGEKTIVMQ